MKATPLPLRSLRAGLVALAGLSAGLAAVPACGGREPDPPIDPTDPSAALFDPEHVVEVVVTMDPADWDALRTQTRNVVEILGGDCLDAPFPNPFTYFHADVTVDGDLIPDVGIRKKGFLGSLDETKPSLKIKVDEWHTPGDGLPDTYLGLEKITLNNSKQDASFLHQCLAYAVFADAGIPAPRCNFAHVTVNGADLGVYVNVESLDKDFLERHFTGTDAGEGNMYEGTLSDFRVEWINTFERKTNEDLPTGAPDENRDDLYRVLDVVDTSTDAELLDALSTVIDMDEFFTFWAAEVLLLHWDGYANNTNNFYIYNSGDYLAPYFTFIPWGTDGAMVDDPFQNAAVPASVYASGVLAWRLYAIPEAQTLYIDRLRLLLDTVWDEASLQAEVDRMESLLLPIHTAAGGDVAEFGASVDNVRAFIAARRGAILFEINGTPPVWDQPLRDPFCLEFRGDVSGSFDTTFGTLGGPNPFGSGTGTVAGTLDMTTIAWNMIASVAGWDPEQPPGTMAQVQVLGTLANGTIDLVLLAIDPTLFTAGNVVPLDWGSAFGAYANFDPASGAVIVYGYLMNGYVELTAAGTDPADPVIGTFAGQIVNFGG